MEIRPETAFGDMRSADLMLVQGFPNRSLVSPPSPVAAAAFNFSESANNSSCGVKLCPPLIACHITSACAAFRAGPVE